MTVIDIQELNYSIGVRTLLAIKNLQVQAGQRIGLVGKNGSGKTTLFQILMNELEADVGNFSVDGRVALLPQLKSTATYKSGGEVSQDYVVRVLNQSPRVLLADEPTTNLDTSHVEWVEKALVEFQGSVLLVSHDRTLLDNVCDTIWELDEGKITEYSGNYSSYVKQKENEQKHQHKEYEKYKEKEQQLEAAIDHKERQAQRATKKPKDLSISENRILGAKTYYQGQQKGLHQNRKALETRLEKLEVVEKPKEEMPVKMTLPNARAFKNKTIIRAEKLSGQAGDKKLWDPATFFLKGSDKVGIIGPNGSGKTTLLKEIINDSNDHLYVSTAVKIGYFAQDLDILDIDKSIIANVKEDSKQSETLIRTVLARLGFESDTVHKEVKVLSGGERVKVSLAKIFVSDCNTLILDEPTNYLDIYALEALEDLLKEYEGTILCVSHDRQFISAISTKILAFENGALELFNGSYEEFENRRDLATRDMTAEHLAKIEMDITNVLGKLGDPMISEENKEKLEDDFQQLLKKKRVLEE